jgi:hypothetical protein
VPLDASTLGIVVVNRFGPLDFDSRVNFGKLWRPFGKAGLEGQVSTTMSQSVISTDSTISLRLKIVHHGTTSSIFFAVRNGRSVGASPSMTRFSTANTPGVIFADSLRM